MFQVSGSVFHVPGSRFRVSCFGFRVPVCRLRVPSIKFRVRVPCSVCRISGSVLKDLSSRFHNPGARAGLYLLIVDVTV